MSDIWYEANPHNATIKKVLIAKESEKFVTLASELCRVDQRRVAKDGGQFSPSYRKTWEEAYSFLYSRAMAKQLKAESLLTEAILGVRLVERLKGKGDAHVEA